MLCKKAHGALLCSAFRAARLCRSFCAALSCSGIRSLPRRLSPRAARERACGDLRIYAYAFLLRIFVGYSFGFFPHARPVIRAEAALLPTEIWRAFGMRAACLGVQRNSRGAKSEFRTCAERVANAILPRKSGFLPDLIGYAMFLFRKLIFCAKWTCGEKTADILCKLL